MEAKEEDKKSYFDIMEERSECPTIFVWSTDLSQHTYTEEELLYQGTLLTLRDDPARVVEHQYILTLQSLIRCKVQLESRT